MYLFRHSFDRLSDAFYWPVVDLLLWGLTGLYIKNSGGAGQLNVITMILSGILLWIIVWRGQYEITVNLLEDLWNKNLINIFGSPLRFSEWISAFLIIGLLKSIVSLLFASLIAYWLYQFNIFTFGYYLLPFFMILIMFGWSVGFLVAGVILRFGSKIQTLAWTAVMVLSPFSAIYYPLSILPAWAQKVAVFIPASYIFEGGRKLLLQQRLNLDYFFIPLILNALYLILAIIWVKSSFEKVLEKKGLVKIF